LILDGGIYFSKADSACVLPQIHRTDYRPPGFAREIQKQHGTFAGENSPPLGGPWILKTPILAEAASDYSC
jgi:hypothetical protein